MDSLRRRHIQNFSDADALEPHWGYADRAVPCKNDAGSCEYLDVVYHSHDLGMLYAGIFWATIGGILLVLVIVRKSYSPNPQSGVTRLFRSLSSLSHRWLLPEFIRPIFGNTTRLQVLILSILVGYLTIWTFIGIVYKKWVTPIKNSSLHNTRTSLGPLADRVGVLAYALMPFSIMLANRESILSLITGVPYHYFNFLHRWLGYVIFAQSIIHSVGWIIIETALYQPQPKVSREWITQKYMIWGVVAQILFIFIFVSSLPPVIRLTGYEFFRKSHYVVAMLFLGACWGHWSNLSCFMIASLSLWFIDRGIRLVRTALIHYSYLPNGRIGFTSANAIVTRFPDQVNGDVIRLDFEHAQDAWKVGQHFYLCFPELGIWQSHPFTPASVPLPGGLQHHTYIIRSKRGQTRNLASLAASKNSTTSKAKEISSNTLVTTPVILTGPYSVDIMSGLDNDTNVLCVAGGTGVTYVLPVLLALATQRPASSSRKVECIWAVRMEADATWILSELDIIYENINHLGLLMKIYVTRECCNCAAIDSAAAKPATQSNSKPPATEIKEEEIASASSSASDSSGSKSGRSRAKRSKRPNLRSLTASFVENTIRGPTTVFASGPAGMISDLREAVASCNNPSKVWRGEERHDVKLICDDRVEW